MLTIKNRLTERERNSDPHMEFLPIERSGRRLTRGLSLESSRSIDETTMDQYDNNEIMEMMNKIEKENENIRLENLLYSRYLRRVNSSKRIETFDEYEDESDVTHIEEGITSNQTSVHARLPEIARRLSVKKSSISSSKAIPLWSKIAINWRELMYAPFLLRVEQEKLSIAAYEIEQAHLDWERMKANADLALDHLEVLLRVAESNELAQDKLNHDLEKNIHKFRDNIGSDEFNNPRLTISAELITNRIHKRVHSRLSVIGLLHIDNTRAQTRIRTIDTTINTLEDLRDTMDEADINFVRTRKIDYSDTYKKLDRKYKIEKSLQYPLLHRLHDWKKMLNEQENDKIDYENKCQHAENRLEKINNEIDFINQENKLMLNENGFLRNRIADIKEVPTITDYAHIIEQTKQLQHGIDIWTKRVNIAETFLSQLKRQTKPPSVLPPLKPTVSHQC